MDAVDLVLPPQVLAEVLPALLLLVDQLDERVLLLRWLLVGCLVAGGHLEVVQAVLALPLQAQLSGDPLEVLFRPLLLLQPQPFLDLCHPLDALLLFLPPHLLAGGLHVLQVDHSLPLLEVLRGLEVRALDHRHYFRPFVGDGAHRLLFFLFIDYKQRCDDLVR